MTDRRRPTNRERRTRLFWVMNICLVLGVVAFSLRGLLA